MKSLLTLTIILLTKTSMATELLCQFRLQSFVEKNGKTILDDTKVFPFSSRVSVINGVAVATAVLQVSPNTYAQVIKGDAAQAPLARELMRGDRRTRASGTFSSKTGLHVELQYYTPYKLVRLSSKGNGKTLTVVSEISQTREELHRLSTECLIK